MLRTIKVRSTAFNIASVIAVAGWLALFAYPLWP